ncbi:WXG100 family type VII secretion target [Peterkaempfera bronchialis]|uniref:Putative T7SS secretion signal domain-containing protein n=1 Tax=Peterkaempfera bronchialis TaxID=2126346 RepID=A0A345SW28_9ACTN|nr:hypothetical protein [Peterkaempfera bronchialis]AXI77933.1 hypothetical protein C7M71_011285 [Peterkaempfera bronchialis]
MSIGFGDWAAPLDREGFDAIGFDPSPGSLPGIQALVGDLQQAAKELQDACDSVRRASNNGQAWQGEAADAFSARIAKLPGQLDVAHASFESARRTMADWHDRLATMQQQAADQEAQAKAAKARRDQAADNPDLKLAGVWLPDDQLPDAEARFRKAQADLHVADADLQAIIARAEALRADHDQLAQQAAQAVAKAGDQAPDGPGWFANLLDSVKKIAAAHIQLAKDAMAWAKAHANAIAAVGDLLSNASTLVGLVALGCAAVGLEPAAAVLDGVSIGLSGAALGVHSVAALAGADVPLSSFAVDVMGTLPVLGALGKAGKLGTDAAKVAKATKFGDDAGKWGTGYSVIGWLGDASGVKQFVPRDNRQWGEVMLPGGPLLVGLENAWQDGSEKDKAAAGKGN